MQRAFSPSGYLDRQADQIEALLLDYEAPARVEGGVVREDRVRYHLTPNVGIGVQNSGCSCRSVAESLGVEGLQIQTEADMSLWICHFVRLLACACCRCCTRCATFSRALRWLACRPIKDRC